MEVGRAFQEGHEYFNFSLPILSHSTYQHVYANYSMLAIKNSTLHEAKESKRQLSLLSLDPWFSNSTIQWLIIWLSVLEAFVLPNGVMKLEGCFHHPEFGWKYQEILLSELLGFTLARTHARTHRPTLNSRGSWQSIRNTRA